MTSKKSLILLLVLLQLIAPLIHAHVHHPHHFFKSGIHVPGLETFNISNSISANLVSESLIEDSLTISMASGIQYQSDDLDDRESFSDHFAWYLAIAAALNLSYRQISYSPPIQTVFLSQLFKQANSSRAPPL